MMLCHSISIAHPIHSLFTAPAHRAQHLLGGPLLWRHGRCPLLESHQSDREQTRELALTTEGFSASFSLRVRPSLHMHIAQTFGRGRNRSRRRSPHFGYRKLVLPFSHFRETCEKKKVDFRREPCFGGERRRHKD